MKLNIDLLQKLWSAISDRPLNVEVSDTDVEGLGPEVWLDNTVAIWPSVVEAPGTPSITDPEPEPKTGNGWAVARMVVIYNYPHAPDDMDYVDETSHFREEDAIVTALMLLVETHLDNALTNIYEDAYQKEMEAAEADFQD